MIKIEEQIEFRNKIVQGLRVTYTRLLEYKKQKNSVLVVLRDNKIVKIKP